MFLQELKLNYLELIKMNLLKEFNKFIKHFKRKYKYIYHFLDYEILSKAFSNYKKLSKNTKIFKKDSIVYFENLTNQLLNDTFGKKNIVFDLKGYLDKKSKINKNN